MNALPMDSIPWALHHPSRKKASLFAASSAEGAGQALLEKKEGSVRVE